MSLTLNTPYFSRRFPNLIRHLLHPVAVKLMPKFKLNALTHHVGPELPPFIQHRPKILRRIPDFWMVILRVFRCVQVVLRGPKHPDFMKWLEIIPLFGYQDGWA